MITQLRDVSATRQSAEMAVENQQEPASCEVHKAVTQAPAVMKVKRERRFASQIFHPYHLARMDIQDDAGQASSASNLYIQINKYNRVRLTNCQQCKMDRVITGRTPGRPSSSSRTDVIVVDSRRE
jgi:hypothetical protein